MVLPIAGAVIGSATGAPVGIVAGLKAARLAAFSGGILGELWLFGSRDVLDTDSINWSRF